MPEHIKTDPVEQMRMLVAEVGYPYAKVTLLDDGQPACCVFSSFNPEEQVPLDIAQKAGRVWLQRKEAK